MATSDSEDFESADEGFDAEDSPKKKPEAQAVKQTEQKSSHQPAAPQPTQENLQQEEPVADSAWEPEDLDDDILDNINEQLVDPVEQINKTVEGVSIADDPCPTAKSESNKEAAVIPDVESESKNLDVADLQPPEPESKERRPRRVREAKGISKVASGGSKKLGSKLSNQTSKPEDEENETEQLESNQHFADKPARSRKDESEELANEPEINQRLKNVPVEPAVSSVLDKLSSTLEQQPEQSSVTFSQKIGSTYFNNLNYFSGME